MDESEKPEQSIDPFHLADWSPVCGDPARVPQVRCGAARSVFRLTASGVTQPLRATASCVSRSWQTLNPRVRLPASTVCIINGERLDEPWSDEGEFLPCPARRRNSMPAMARWHNP